MPTTIKTDANWNNASVEATADFNAQIAELTAQSGRANENAQNVSLRQDALADKLTKLEATGGYDDSQIKQSIAALAQQINVVTESARIAAAADTQALVERVKALEAAIHGLTSEAGE